MALFVKYMIKLTNWGAGLVIAAALLLACQSGPSLIQQPIEGSTEQLGYRITSVTGPVASYTEGNYRVTPKDPTEGYILVNIEVTNRGSSQQTVDLSGTTRLEPHKRILKSKTSDKEIEVPNIPTNVRYCNVFSGLLGDLTFTAGYEEFELGPGDSACRTAYYFFKKGERPERLIVFEFVGEKVEGKVLKTNDLLTIEIPAP